MRAAIDNNWCIPTDPTGNRVRVAQSLPRRDGKTANVIWEVDRDNKVLSDKMSYIMQGKYKSSTVTDFHSSKFFFLFGIVRKRIASQGE